jgi:gliding motility-associated-like protein
MSKNAIAKVQALPMVDFSFEKTMDSLQYTEFQFYDSTKGTKPFSYSWELGEGILSSMQNPKVLYSDTGYQTVILTVTDSNSCENSQLKEIYRLPKNTPFVPSAFSPNSDEHNGLFKVHGVAYARNFKMEIYSRWGELIFETTDLHQAWDGSFKGKPVAEGVYLYKITYAGLHKELVRSFGTVTLLR